MTPRPWEIWEVRHPEVLHRKYVLVLGAAGSRTAAAMINSEAGRPETHVTLAPAHTDAPEISRPCHIQCSTLTAFAPSMMKRKLGNLESGHAPEIARQVLGCLGNSDLARRRGFREFEESLRASLPDKAKRRPMRKLRRPAPVPVQIQKRRPMRTQPRDQALSR